MSLCSVWLRVCSVVPLIKCILQRIIIFLSCLLSSNTLVISFPQHNPHPISTLPVPFISLLIFLFPPKNIYKSNPFALVKYILKMEHTHILKRKYIKPKYLHCFLLIVSKEVYWTILFFWDYNNTWRYKICPRYDKSLQLNRYIIHTLFI